MTSLFDRALRASKRKPKKQTKPKAPKPAPRSNTPIARAVRQVGRTAQSGGGTVEGAARARVSRAVSEGRPVTIRRKGASGADAEFERAGQRAREVRRRGGPVRVKPSGTTKIAGLNLTPEQISASVAQAQHDPPLGWISNVAGDALDIFTGIPAQAQIVGENFAAFNPVIGPLGQAGRMGVPGLGWAENYQNRVIGMDVAAGKAIGQDYKTRYPIFSGGSWSDQWEQVKQHPLLTALDLAVAKGAIGKAPNVPGRIAERVAPDSDIAAVSRRRKSGMTAAERAQAAGVTTEDLAAAANGIVPAVKGVRRKFAVGEGGRRRAPKVYEGRPSEGGPVTRKEVPRRAYSSDAINRGVQKAADRVAARVVPKIERRAEAIMRRVKTEEVPLRTKLAKPFAESQTRQAKFNKSREQMAFTAKDRAEAMADAIIGQITPEATRALNALKKDKNEAGVALKGLSSEQAAARLYLGDILESGGKGRGGRTNAEIRDILVDHAEKQYAELEALARENPKAAGATIDEIAPSLEKARQQLEAIRRISDDILDPTSNTPASLRVQAAVREGRRLDAISQQMAVETQAAGRGGGVTAKTAREVRSRDSALTVGGSEPWRKAVMRKKREYRPRIDAIKQRLADIRSGKEPAPRGTITRLERELKNTRKNMRREIDAIKADALEITPQVKAARMERNAAEWRLMEAQRSGAKGEHVSALTRARDRVKKHLSKVEDEYRRFTSPTRPELVGKRGVYIKDEHVNGVYRRVNMTRGYRPGKTWKSKGNLKHGVLIDMNPNLLVETARRSAQNRFGRVSEAAFRELVDNAAFYDDKGRLITGDRRSMLTKLDPDEVVLLHSGNFRQAVNKISDLDNGKFLAKQELATSFKSPEALAEAKAGVTKGGEKVGDLLPDGTRASDYVAISRAAAEIWTDVMVSGKWAKRWDTALNWWKGGILALSPRWYLNNTFGLALQYGLMTGGDLKAVRMTTSMTRAFSPLKRERLPATRRAITKRNPEAVMDTFADELQGIRGGDLPAFMRFGFRVNGRLEEYWRRAAYFNRAKGQIRRETGLNLNKLSDQEIAAAIERMPEPMARSIVRDIDFFIGNFRKFKPWERQIKRFIPFYSWLRVIARLTFVLPFRSPTRLLALSTLNKAQRAGINPLDEFVDYWGQGPLSIAGYKLPTWSLNPWQSLAPVLALVGGDSKLGSLIEETVGWSHPIIQFAYSQASGTDPFGQALILSPNARPNFGQQGKWVYNRSTRRWQREKVRVPMIEATLGVLAPAQLGFIRNAIARGRTPFDDATTAELIANEVNKLMGHEGEDKKLYLPKKKNLPRENVGITGYTKPFGITIQKQNDKALIDKWRRDQAEGAASARRNSQ